MSATGKDLEQVAERLLGGEFEWHRAAEGTGSLRQRRVIHVPFEVHDMAVQELVRWMSKHAERPPAPTPEDVGEALGVWFNRLTKAGQEAVGENDLGMLAHDLLEMYAKTIVKAGR